MKRIAACAAAGFLASILLVGNASAALIGKGKKAPAWSGKTVEGKSLASSQFKGKVVLLNFFSYS